MLMRVLSDFQPVLKSVVDEGEGGGRDDGGLAELKPGTSKN